jgi:hypothetical protein
MNVPHRRSFWLVLAPLICLLLVVAVNRAQERGYAFVHAG